MITNQHYADYTGLINALGLVTAQTEFDENRVYTEEIYEQAFSVANAKFNLAAEALAAATENIDHMFEWNTAGINRRGGAGGGKGRSASDEASRLWTPLFVGAGKQKTIAFTFKPSLLKVPKPTTRESGMSQDSINKLKEHRFPNRAMVFELGEEVTVRRKDAKALVIPYSPYATNRTKSIFTKYEKQRGFAFRPGPYTFAPGRVSGQAGEFTKFWTAYWNNPGVREMTHSIVDQVNEDFDSTGLALKANTPRPVQRIKMKKEIQSARNSMSKRAVARAKRRGKKLWTTTK